ncbi:HipA family kinase [Rhizobium sp. BK591]|uniref:HipA family kinase n=1 Tax=Rhizobium sp. BK591 TaxID=2586985 RepID=UPI0039180C23
MPIEIEEVLRRSDQGVTRPYICRGADGKLYYVKGKDAGYESLVKEWIAGTL